MKTLFLSLLLAGSLAAGASGTKEKAVASYRTLQNFITEFGNIDDVKWSNCANNLTKADFILEDEPTVAYFNEDGDFVASTKASSFDALPKKIQAAVKEKQPGASITNVFEMYTSQETSWFIETAVNNEKKVWKANEAGLLTRYFVKR